MRRSAASKTKVKHTISGGRRPRPGGTSSATLRLSCRELIQIRSSFALSSLITRPSSYKRTTKVLSNRKHHLTKGIRRSQQNQQIMRT